MTRPLRVFLCHASQDKPAVRKLYRYLKLRGVQPWLDELDLLPGENWEVEIPNALFSSDVILVCLSKNSVDKEGYVQKEISFALDKAMEKPEGTIFIVPVKLELCDVPKRLNRFQWVDLFRPDGYKRLMLGLQKRAIGLGADVSPVILDDTRRTPAPKTPKPEIKKPEEPISFSPREKGRDEGKPREEPKREIPVSPLKEKEPEVKFTQQKPFTKLLDPASLSQPPAGRVPKPTEPVAPKKHQAKNPTYGFWGIALLVLILGGFGLNYLFKNTPVATVTASPTNTAMPKPPTLGVGSTQVSEKDGMTLLYVPAGEFRMGNNADDALEECQKFRTDCSRDWFTNEEPPHSVYLDAFWIDQTEVTNEMYAKCVDAGKCDPPSDINYFSKLSYANHPVVYVDWNKANAYCSWAGRRLPTEAEWEKAARGTDGFTYPWGNDAPNDTFLNYNQNVGSTTEVGNYPSGKSIYGAYDMAGNVWEWVSSLYKSYPYDASDGREDLISSGDRVLRGGSWGSLNYNARSANRYWYSPDGTYSGVGFRCARSLP